MNKVLIFVFGIVIIPFILFCCEPPNEKEEPKFHSKNIVIILDLSDRIILNTNQIEHDSAIITNIYQMYINRAKKIIMENNKDFLLATDKISVIIAPQKRAPEISSKILKPFYRDLKNIGQNNKGEFRYVFNQFLNDISLNTSNLYKEAKFSKNPDDYSGADIWEVFNSIEVDKKYQNYIIVLTDGYMFVDGIQSARLGDWPIINKDFYPTKVAVLELLPNSNRNELNRLNLAWKSWLNNMNISNDNILIMPTGNLQESIDKLNIFIEDSVFKTQPDRVTKKKAESTQKKSSNLISNNNVKPKKKNSITIKHNTNKTTTIESANNVNISNNVSKDNDEKIAKTKIEINDLIVDFKNAINENDQKSINLYSKLTTNKCEELLSLYKTNPQKYKREIEKITEVIDQLKPYTL